MKTFLKLLVVFGGLGLWAWVATSQQVTVTGYGPQYWIGAAGGIKYPGGDIMINNGKSYMFGTAYGVNYTGGTLTLGDRSTTTNVLFYGTIMNPSFNTAVFTNLVASSPVVTDGLNELASGTATGTGSFMMSNSPIATNVTIYGVNITGRAGITNITCQSVTNVDIPAGTFVCADVNSKLIGRSYTGAAGSNVVLQLDATIVNATLTGSSQSAVTNSDFAAAAQPVWSMASKVLTNYPPATAKLALGIQAGTTTLDATGLDGVFTNTVTFPTAFGSAPVVVVSYNIAANADATHMTNCFATNVTASTFWVGGGKASAPISWIAIGAP